MWFKNVIFGKLNDEFECSVELLEERLEEAKFVPVGTNQFESIGFVPPMPSGLSEQLVHTANGRSMICLQIQTKIIPAQVVAEQVDEIVERIESREGRKVTNKEKTALKEDVTVKLMPQAFSTKAKIYAFFDFNEKLFVINTASNKAADTIISFVRKALGSFPVRAVHTKRDPDYIMTEWVNGTAQLPGDLYFGSACRLKDSESSIATLQNTDMESDEVKIHVEKGKRMDRLQLTWCDAITFSLQDCNIRSIKYLDVVQDQLDDVEVPDRQSLFDATFMIMAEEIVDLINDIVDYFGGEETVELDQDKEDA